MAQQVDDAVAPSLATLVELACRAPSVYGTQPWSWREVAGGLELHADLRRRLTVADPAARQLVISCGAALHHAQVAAAALGWRARVSHRLERGAPRSHLATLALDPARPTDAALNDLQALVRRRTDRRPPTGTAVPPTALSELIDSAIDWGVRAVPARSPDKHSLVRDLTVLAEREMRRVDGYLGERRRWGVRDGDAGPHGRISDTEGVLVLCHDRDDAPAWLRTGEALSALWLRATRRRLAVVPVSPVVEVPRTRAMLRTEVSAGRHPHLLLRLGGRPALPPVLPATPRRSVSDVLRP